MLARGCGRDSSITWTVYLLDILFASSKIPQKLFESCLLSQNVKTANAFAFAVYVCGEDRIRTCVWLPTTHFPSVRFKPLSHFSVCDIITHCYKSSKKFLLYFRHYDRTAKNDSIPYVYYGRFWGRLFVHYNVCTTVYSG